MLHAVAWATTMARLLYASLVWWGYLTALDQDHLEHFSQRMGHARFLPPGALVVATLTGRADDVLFTALFNDPTHVLRSTYQ